MRSLRVQGREAGPTDSVWLGLSQLLPGGHTSLAPAAVEKIDACIAGEVTVRTDREEATLGPLDCQRLPAGAGEPNQPARDRPAGHARDALNRRRGVLQGP
jgi:uncharacterized cupin superfamily protein